MPEITYATFEEKDAAAVVRLWNEMFASQRNFFELDVAEFERRVSGNRNSLEVFDPMGFILAREGGKLAGFIHAGVRNEIFCKAAYSDWQGGSEGYIAVVCVAGPFQKRGIGTELVNRAKKYMYGTSRIIVDGQCLNPFYGNSEGPMIPPWGTTEGISVPADDQAVRALFKKFGFEKRYTGVSLELDLTSFSPSADEAPEGYTKRVYTDSMPAVGAPAGLTIPYRKQFTFEAVSLEKDSVTAAVASSFPMPDLPGKKEGIYEIKVHDDHRDRGLGSFLLGTLLASMKDRGAEVCEVLSVPELSPRSPEFYGSFGFEEAARWDIY